MLVLLDRYGETTDRDILAVSLIGAGITLGGLLLLAVATGLQRGSGLSRLIATLELGGILALDAVLWLALDVNDTGAAVIAALVVALVVLLWTPPTARTFGRIRDSSMTWGRPSAAPRA